MQLSTVILPSQRWQQAQPMWERAEQYGLDAAYTYDHLSWRNFRERPWFTMMPTLVAAAGVTSAIKLGPLVTSPNFRHPLLLAKEFLALDDISRGRLIVAVGSGGTGFDASALGRESWSTKERHERFVEFTRTLEVLLREPATSRPGTYYPIVESRQIPGPVQLPRPPLYLSATGPKTMALTAEIADGWVSLNSATTTDAASTYASARHQMSLMHETLSAQRRDPRSLHKVFLDQESDDGPLRSFDAFIEWAGRYHELGFDELVIHWPILDSQFDYNVEVFERIAVEGHQQIQSWRH
jgi:alkanesulfonate monooxygenase SsuD/methylene tetrahydromethanopterin reductase-like flavin-dependent oxidoreductase (luciferase family)